MIEGRDFQCENCKEIFHVLGRVSTPTRCLKCGYTILKVIRDSGPATVITSVKVQKCNLCGKPPEKADYRYCGCGGTIITTTQKITNILRGM